MATVPSTPTATDKWEEIRKLNIDIAGLKSAKDTADRACRDATEAADDAMKRSKELEDKIKSFENSIGEVSEEMREFVASCRNVLQSVVSTMEMAAIQAKQLSGKIGQLIEEIKKLEGEKKSLLESINRENELISAQRADLEIYHGRIIKAAEEHLPGQKVEIPKSIT